MNYLFECECNWKQRIKLSKGFFKCKNCNEQFVVGSYFLPYKLVETKATLFQDVQQRKLKGSLVPNEVRNKINQILGKKCDYTDKRKDYYSMKWYGTYSGDIIFELYKIPKVQNIVIKRFEDYPKNMPSYFKKPCIRVYVEKLKGEKNGIQQN
jgi:hypothetical protein